MMATAEQHFATGEAYAQQVAQGFVEAQQAGQKINAGEVLMLGQLHVALGQLRVELDRPGRGLVLPTNHR